MHLFVDPKTDGGQYHPTFYFELAAQYSGRIAFVLRAISQADMTPFGIQKAHQTPSLGTATSIFLTAFLALCRVTYLT